MLHTAGWDMVGRKEGKLEGVLAMELVDMGVEPVMAETEDVEEMSVAQVVMEEVAQSRPG